MYPNGVVRGFPTKSMAKRYVTVRPRLANAERYIKPYPKDAGVRYNINCPDCNGHMIISDGLYGRYYRCRCGVTHGAHPDGTPMGTPADAETKVLRIKAHRYMDRLWVTRQERLRVYIWLERLMNLSRWDCHIAMFNQEQCTQAIEACRSITFRKLHGYAYEIITKETNL